MGTKEHQPNKFLGREGVGWGPPNSGEKARGDAIGF